MNNEYKDSYYKIKTADVCTYFSICDKAVYNLSLKNFYYIIYSLAQEEKKLNFKENKRKEI